MTLQDATLILYCFSLDFTMTDTHKLLPHIAYSTLVTFFNKIRDRIFLKWENVRMNGNVNGETEVIEIDESIFGKKHKYHKGSPTKRQWVFGIMERNTKKTYFVPVSDRSKATLIPIIKKIVKRGSCIYHDDWAAYRNLKNEGYQHGTVVHTKEFVSESGVCTNSIEGEQLCTMC